MRVRVDDAGKQRAAKKIVSGQSGGRRCGCSRKKRSSALRACGVRKKHTCSIKKGVSVGIGTILAKAYQGFLSELRTACHWL